MSQIKLTVAQATALLKAAGAPVVEIVTDEAQATPDFKEDAVLAEIDKARLPIIRPQIEGEIKDTIIKTANGQTSGAYKSALYRAFQSAGVTRPELDKYDDLNKMMEDLLSKHNATFSKDTEALREELKTAAAKHNEALAAKDKEWQEKLQESQQKFVERDIDEVLSGVVKQIPRTGGNEMVQARQLKQYLRDQYHIHYDEAKKTIELRDKENKEMPVYANESKSAFLKAEDAAKTFLSDLGVVATDNRHASAQDAMKNAGATGSAAGSNNGAFAQPDEVAAHIDGLFK